MIFSIKKIASRTILFVLTTTHMHAMEFWQPPSFAGPLQQAQRAAARHLWSRQEATTPERAIIIQSALDTMFVAMVQEEQKQAARCDIDSDYAIWQLTTREKMQRIAKLIPLIKDPKLQAQVQQNEDHRLLEEIKAIVKVVEHQEFSFLSYCREQAELDRTVGYPEFDEYMNSYIAGKRGSVLMRYNYIKDQKLRTQLTANDELWSKEIILSSWNRNSQQVGETSERACTIRATLCQIIDYTHFFNALNQWRDGTTEPDVHQLCDLQKEVTALQQKASPEVITLETSRPPLPATQPTPQEQEWGCPACTFFNKPNAVVCEVCGRAR
jgi:hypothetical protein